MWSLTREICDSCQKNKNPFPRMLSLSCRRAPPDPLPEGEVFQASADTWYNLQVHYTDDKGNPLTSLMYPLGPNPSTSFYEYMVLGTYRSAAGKAPETNE
jgi:hypothetical protein